jgi:hypothetical protein
MEDWPDVIKFDRSINTIVEESFEEVPDETKAKVLELYAMQLRGEG